MDDCRLTTQRLCISLCETFARSWRALRENISVKTLTNKGFTQSGAKRDTRKDFYGISQEFFSNWSKIFLRHEGGLSLNDRPDAMDDFISDCIKYGHFVFSFGYFADIVIFQFRFHSNGRHSGEVQQ